MSSCNSSSFAQKENQEPLISLFEGDNKEIEFSDVLRGISSPSNNKEEKNYDKGVYNRESFYSFLVKEEKGKALKKKNKKKIEHRRELQLDIENLSLI